MPARIISQVVPTPGAAPEDLEAAASLSLDRLATQLRRAALVEVGVRRLHGDRLGCPHAGLLASRSTRLSGYGRRGGCLAATELKARPRRINRSLGMGRAAETALAELPERLVSGAEDEAGSVHDQDAGRHAENLDEKSALSCRDIRVSDCYAVVRHRLGMA
jgi:hypothetical protein